jgi:hypothetical protein
MRWTGSAIGERVAQIDANEVVTFMHNDKQYSKCAIALRATLARGVIAISDAVGNPVGRRGYGAYGGEADQGEVRGTSTPRNDPAQMVGTTSAGTSPPPALRAFSSSKRFPEPPKPFGYTGRRWDPDLGLFITAPAGMIHNWARSCRLIRLDRWIMSTSTHMWGWSRGMGRIRPGWFPNAEMAADHTIAQQVHSTGERPEIGRARAGSAPHHRDHRLVPCDRNWQTEKRYFQGIERDLFGPEQRFSRGKLPQK